MGEAEGEVEEGGEGELHTSGLGSASKSNVENSENNKVKTMFYYTNTFTHFAQHETFVKLHANNS